MKETNIRAASGIFVSLCLFVVLSISSCSGNPSTVTINQIIPQTQTITKMETLPPVQTIIQTETQTQIVTRTVTTTYFNSTDAPSSSFTQDWAINQVNAYLCNLATSPPAIRYLAELNSEIWREANFYPTEVDQDYQGHKYSGWQVYFRNADERYLSRPYWSDLNWVVFKDGFVTELSNGALQVKADLIELNQ